MFGLMNTRTTHLALLLLLCPFCALAEADDESCKDERVRNEVTYGHCCWPGQNWSKDELRCVGLAECPMGRIPSDDGEDCVKADCGTDRIETEGGCCWKGQTWSKKKSRCVGQPRCPKDHVARRQLCVPVEPLPDQETLPYIQLSETDYIEVKAGPYTRGSRRRESGRFRNERSHTVALTRKVLVKRTEVTQREWQQLVPHNPSRFIECGPDCPVERVNWYEALTWLNRLSTIEGLKPCYELTDCTGQLGGGCRVPSEGSETCLGDYTCVVSFKGLNCEGFRLPTEAEWEYAARSGTTTSTYGGNVSLKARRDAAVLESIAWYQGNSGVDFESGRACVGSTSKLCGTHPVGQLKATKWGHRDMLGNVMEWVWDGYGRYPSRSAVDPVQHLGVERVIRGGSWASTPRFLRAAVRSRLSPLGRNSELGFRAVRTVFPTQIVTDKTDVDSADAGSAKAKEPHKETETIFVGPPSTVTPEGNSIRIRGGDEFDDAPDAGVRTPAAPMSRKKKPKRSRKKSRAIKLKVVSPDE
jgi:formylglycine-generating enzyme required for sulfatase activity